MTDRLKKLLFISILGFGFPLILLLCGELFLRLAGAGYPTSPLIQMEVEGQPAWVGNPDFTRLFFPQSLKRLPPPNRVSVDKDAATRRYMVVGGSAAAGDPDTDFSISRILEWILDAYGSGNEVEVINLAYTACNSHVALEVIRQSQPYDLDGILVLVGNNEVIGPFGPGSSLTGETATITHRDWRVRLGKFKLVQVIQALREKLFAVSGDAQQWKGMAQFIEQAVPADDPRLDVVYANFQSNLEEMETIARTRGIPVFLSNVPVNLLDQPPFQEGANALPGELAQGIAQWMETGRSPWAVQDVIKSAGSHGKSARLHYMAGKLLFESGRPDEATRYLRRAVDLDTLRFRADTRINQIIRDQWQQPDGIWIPVDAERPLIEDSPKQTLGYPHFYEHVHFSYRANFLIAREMARVLLQHENLDTSRVEALEWTEAASALAYTPYEVWSILGEVLRRFESAPYTGIPGYARSTAWMRQLHEHLESLVSKAESKEEMSQAYLAAIRNRPEDDRLKLNFAQFLAAFDKPEAAFTVLREIFPRNPTDSELALAYLGVCLKLGHEKEATQALERVELIFPDHPNIGAFREDLAK